VQIGCEKKFHLKVGTVIANMKNVIVLLVNMVREIRFSSKALQKVFGSCQTKE
jgi:hypothetical protein